MAKNSIQLEKIKQIEMLISVGDPEGVWSLFQDMNDLEACKYISERYFNY